MKTVIGKSRIKKDAMPAALIDAENGADLDDRLQRIATAAYYRAEARGFVPGLEMEDWLQAEAEVDAAAEQ